jgi:hypothetical protein
LFTESLNGDQLLASPPFSGALSATPSLCWVLVFNSLFIVQFFFLQGVGQSAQGVMLVYPRGGWGNTAWCLVLTCLVCQMSPKHVCCWRLAAVGALLFSQCNVTWKSFPRARGSGYRSFDSPCCFISAKHGSSISARFWSQGAHAVCFSTLVDILDLPQQLFDWMPDVNFTLFCNRYFYISINTLSLVLGAIKLDSDSLIILGQTILRFFFRMVPGLCSI